MFAIFVIAILGVQQLFTLCSNQVIFNDVSEWEDEGSDEEYGIVNHRSPRQTPGWQKFNQAFIDVVNKSSMLIPAIPFVVNIQCDVCKERMGKLACCFFITWWCCRNGTIPAGE